MQSYIHTSPKARQDAFIQNAMLNLQRLHLTRHTHTYTHTHTHTHTHIHTHTHTAHAQTHTHTHTHTQGAWLTESTNGASNALVTEDAAERTQCQDFVSECAFMCVEVRIHV